MEIELGYSPLYLRYNTGRHISESGRELAEQLERLIAAWPTRVDEVVLIGHSMGGLVARSACHYGAGSDCVAKVHHVVTLGTPHQGAPLEQVTNAATAALARLPETRPLARALNLRSSGIKDLRYGYLVDECWLDQDCDAFVRNTSREIPFLPTARHYFICATLSREADAPVGRILGDLLVLQPSAWAHPGRGKRLQFPVENYYHLGGANHFDLLNHPAIYRPDPPVPSEPARADRVARAALAPLSARSARARARVARAARCAAAARDRRAPTRSRRRSR